MNRTTTKKITVFKQIFPCRPPNSAQKDLQLAIDKKCPENDTSTTYSFQKNTKDKYDVIFNATKKLTVVLTAGKSVSKHTTILYIKFHTFWPINIINIAPTH